jgi:phosphocarrier protein
VTALQRAAVLKNRHGLHARPISRLVEVAVRYSSELTVTHDGRTADGRSILELMTLGAGPGATLTFAARGEDAEELLDALSRLVEEDFGER